MHLATCTCAEATMHADGRDEGWKGGEDKARVQDADEAQRAREESHQARKERRQDRQIEWECGGGRVNERASERASERTRGTEKVPGMMLGWEGIRRKIELHVALFLVLLSPGYNPPRRRRCLYLSRGKPPSRVRVSLPRPLPTLLALRSPRSTALSIHLLAAHSRPPPSNHPLRARSHSPLPHSSASRCTTAVPRHTLFSLSLPPSSSAQSHPP